MQDIEMLPFIFMKAFHLNIKERIRINDNACPFPDN